MTQLVNQFELGKEKGQLDMKFGQNVIQVRANVALTAGQAVKIVDVAGGIPNVDAAGDTDEVFGFVTYDLKKNTVASGEVCAIALKESVMYMTAGAAFAPMTELMHVLATLKVITATGVTKCISGWALDKASADGDVVRVYITSPSFKKPAA